MAARIYSFADAQRLTGVQRGHLSRWAEQGVIAPDLGGGGASGAHRRFSFRNIFEIAVAVELQTYRIHQDILRHVLTRLRMLDPDTIESVNIPVNRVRREIEALPPAERTERLQGIAKSNAEARRRKEGFLFNLTAPMDALAEDLSSPDDNAAKRWNAFKSPLTRTTDAAFIVLSNGVVPAVSFDFTLRDIEESMTASAIMCMSRDLFGASTIVINAARILKMLEKETGDHL